MSHKPQSQFAQLQDLAQYLLSLDSNDPALAAKIVALKGRATRALKTKVGNPDIKDAIKLSVEARRRKAEAFKVAAQPHVAAAKAAGAVSLREIAQYLNDNQVRSPRGNQWSASTVSRILQ